MAQELLLASQRVSPVRALALGYIFKFPLLEPALTICCLRLWRTAPTCETEQPPYRSTAAPYQLTRLPRSC